MYIKKKILYEARRSDELDRASCYKKKPGVDTLSEMGTGSTNGKLIPI